MNQSNGSLENNPKSYYILPILFFINQGPVNKCRTALVKNPFQENFDITLMGNEKAVKTLIAFFSFSIKTLFNQILNQCRTALVNIFLLIITQALYKTFYLILTTGLVPLISPILYSLRFSFYLILSYFMSYFMIFI